MAKAIRALALPHDARAQKEASYEREVSRAAEAHYQMAAAGLMIPHDVMNKRDLTVGGTGQYTVSTKPIDFIDTLKARSVLMSSGATVYENLHGNVSLSRLNTDSTAYDVAEAAATTESTPVFEQVTLTPKIVSANVDVSKLMLNQSDFNVEKMVGDNISKILSLKIDKNGFYAATPALTNTIFGVTEQTGDFAAAVPTRAEALAMIKDVDVANALGGQLVWFGNAVMKSGLRNKAVDAGSGLFLLNDNDEMLGYKYVTTNQITQNDRLVFCNVADLVIALWGGIDLVVDPYTQSKNAMVQITAHQYYDIMINHLASFVWNDNTV